MFETFVDTLLYKHSWLLTSFQALGTIVLVYAALVKDKAQLKILDLIVAACIGFLTGTLAHLFPVFTFSTLVGIVLYVISHRKELERLGETEDDKKKRMACARIAAVIAAVNTNGTSSLPVNSTSTTDDSDKKSQ